MRRIRAGIVGLGYWGPQLLRNFAAQPECEMVYGCDLLEENLAKARNHYPALTYTQDDNDLLRDSSVELILIATPTSSHFPLAKRALEEKKHVFLEKPMTSTAREAEELIALAEKVGKRLFVDHTFVFAPAVAKMASMARGGELGDLLYFDSSRINLGLIQKDTSVLWDLAIHDLSILSTFQDLNEVATIAAHGGKYFGDQEEIAHLHLTFRSGFRAHIAVSWLSPVKIRHTILAGTRAMVTYDDTEPSEKIRIYDRGVERDTSKPDPFFPKYRSGNILIPALPLTETLTLEAQHVLRCLHDTEEALVPGEEGRKVLTILEHAERSIRSGSSPLPLS